MDVLLSLPKIDINAGSSSLNGTALHSAVCSGRQECIEQLVDAGANVAATQANGMTPLHLAAERGRLKTIK